MASRRGELRADDARGGGGGRREQVRWPRHITLFEARSRLYRNEILQPKTHSAAIFKIYNIV